MTTRGLFVTIEAKPGKEQEVEQFLADAAPLVAEEAGTVAWFAVRLGATTFAIFDAFDDDAGRDAHLNGRVAEALFARAEELFATAPAVQPLDVLADKLPHAEGGGWEASEWAGDRPGTPASPDSGGTHESSHRHGGWSASEWSDTDRS